MSRETGRDGAPGRRIMFYLGKQEAFFMSNESVPLSLPGAKSQELLARRQAAVARGVSATLNVFAAKAEGAVIEDVDGNRFLDFAGGIGTMNIGHVRPEVTKAIQEQAEKFTHTCFSVVMYEAY